MAIPLTNRGLKIAASRIGVSVDDYVRHFEAGERWCSRHQRWKSIDTFTSNSLRGTGVNPWCKAACAEADRRRYRARKSEAKP